MSNEELNFDIDWDLIDISMYYVIKEQNDQEYYLSNVKANKIEWTSEFMHALDFDSSKEANEYISQYLPNRTDIEIVLR